MQKDFPLGKKRRAPGEKNIQNNKKKEARIHNKF